MATPQVGDALPELDVTPDKYLPLRYAGVSGDFNPIHIDAEFAKGFRDMGVPESEISITGEVTAVEDGQATVSVVATQEGNQIIRNAEAEIQL